MQIVATDILEQARGLSPGVCSAGCVLGFLLWALGWRLHRFWMVLFVTVIAGIYGLQEGPARGVQPLVGGLLLAVTAGVLALLLMRLLAYAAGGLAALFLVHALWPKFDEPVLCLLGGGLVGLVLFRLWVMVLTSSFGALLMTYSGLCLLDGLQQLDMVALAQQQRMGLNWGVGGAALLGLLFQVLLERRRLRREREKLEERAQRFEELEKRLAPPPRRWWQWGKKKMRKAG